MNRRRFLRAAGSGFAVASAGLAGCLSSDDVPPPRKARVFEDVSIDDGTMKIALDADPKVESRVDAVDGASIVGLLVPVATARAGSRSSSGSGSSGATGRGTGGYSSAPKDRRHGWAIYGGHSNGSWRDDHGDEYDWYGAAIATLGVAYMGSNTAYRRRSPGPGPVDWDETWSDPDPGATFEVDLATLSGSRSDADAGSEPTGNVSDSGAGEAPGNESETDAEGAIGNESDDGAGTEPVENESDAGSVPADEAESAPKAREGWYRVGTRLESSDGAVDFEWQAADFKLERGSTGDLAVDEAWHVRPRL